MELKQLITDDDAVSPVIGVILMVAITVILAAVIGTFVLGIGQGQTTTPTATFEFDFEQSNSTSGILEVRMTSGDTLNDDNSADVNFTGQSVTTPDFTIQLDADGAGVFPVSAGDSFTNTSGSFFSPLGTVETGSTFDVTWSAPGGDKSDILQSFDVPS